MRIRRCQSHDLRSLEWGGEYTHDRAIIAQTFARTLADASVMLVAEVDSHLVGQVWLDLAREDAAYLWALRVRARWRGRGVGSQLLETAEQLALDRDFAAIELDVERTNHRARRLYTRRGYLVVRAAGQTGHVRMCKPLAAVRSGS